MRILVTGGAGFIDPNFVHYILKFGRDCGLLLNLDALSYAGNLENLKAIEYDPHYEFVKGDVRDKALVDKLFDEYDFDTVVHFAAESHVERSITEPENKYSRTYRPAPALLPKGERGYDRAGLPACP